MLASQRRSLLTSRLLKNKILRTRLRLIRRPPIHDDDQNDLKCLQDYRVFAYHKIRCLGSDRPIPEQS